MFSQDLQPLQGSDGGQYQQVPAHLFVTALACHCTESFLRSRSPSAHQVHNIVICHMGSLLRSITSR